jgi:hypothetical protein
MNHIIATFLLSIVFCFQSFASDPRISATVSPNTVLVGSRVIWTLTFNVEEDTIESGTILEILTFAELGDLSFLNVSASASNGASVQDFGLQTVTNPLTTNHPIWDNDVKRSVIKFQMNGAIPPGQNITVVLGTNFTKSKIHNYSGQDEFRAHFKKPDGSYYGIENKIEVTIESFTSKALRAFVPSVVQTNETGNLLRISMVDGFNNRDEKFAGTLAIDCGSNSNLNTIINISAVDRGAIELPLIFNSEGFCQCKVTVLSSNSPQITNGNIYKTNFAWVQDNPGYRIFWGDLHSHSSMSPDGGGGINAFDYAKQVSGLDFFSAAEHNHTVGNDYSSINNEEWAYLKERTTSLYEPGRFIPILGYENNYGIVSGGHHNVYHDWIEPQTIDSIVRYTTTDAPNVSGLFSLLDNDSNKIRTLCFAHFQYVGNLTPQNQLNPPAETFGVRYTNPKYRTTYELFSNHGQSEYYNPDNGLDDRLTYWYAQDALAKGEKVGFIASSDNHTAKPGQPADGLAAAIVPVLERGPIFDALENRLTYATVGDRIIIEFNEGEYPMGSDILLESGAIPVFDFMVHGTAPLDKIELVKWDFFNGVYNGIHPVFNTIATYDDFPDSTLLFSDRFADDGFVANSVYYLRVKQKPDIFVSNYNIYKESWAWSSPIWVSDSIVVANVVEQSIKTLLVRPNPTKEGQNLMIDIESDYLFNQARISVFNLQGQIVYQTNETILPNKQSIRIPTAGFSCGQYYVSISNQDKRLAIEPFIILH